MTKRRCTPSDIIKLNPGSSLHLECGSHCSTSDRERTSTERFSWKKYLDISRSGSVTQLPDTPHPLLSVDSVTHEDGGHYVCKCQSSGQECMYNVSGKWNNLLSIRLFQELRIEGREYRMCQCFVLLCVESHMFGMLIIPRIIAQRCLYSLTHLEMVVECLASPE